MVASNWQPDPELIFVRNFVNAVYRFRMDEATVYLRLTPESHRSEEEIASELHFIHYLASNDYPVAESIPSSGGDWVRRIEVEGSTYLASVFAEAPGREFSTGVDLDGEFFRMAGRSLGRLHRLAQEYTPPSGFTRFEWIMDRWHRFAELVPESEVEAWSLYNELQEWTAGLSCTPSTFGLIHGDFTILNMRIVPERITLFDFDACCHHWFAYEIACFLHYFGAGNADARRLAYQAVLEGYAEMNSVDAAMLHQIPLFGKMRLLYSFLVFAEEWGFDQLTPEQEAYFALRRRLFIAEPTWAEMTPR
jgi:Ser/Thr protein kinase RdoA (MazF antagonist)